MGLGLSICQNIMKKHNGEIKVSSELGKGTEFLVCVPLNIDGENEKSDA
jgi:signal transduction histidine kinase